MSGSDATRVFKVVDGANVTVGGLTIADGVAPLETIELPGGATASARLGGGALVDTGGRLTIIDAVVTRCTTTRTSNIEAIGGGLANLEGTLIVRRSEITGNSAEGGLGGGIGTVTIGRSEAATTVEESAITGNSAATGGGVHNSRGSTLIRESRVSGNKAASGGGVGNFGTLVIEAGEVVGNEASGGGGGLYTNEVATIRGGTIEANGAGTDGGGVNLERGTLVIASDARVTGNGAAERGGGVYIQLGVATIDGGIVEDNAAGTDGGGFYLQRNTIIEVEDTACVIHDNLADADEDGSGTGGGIFNNGADISGVPDGAVCSNNPDQIAP